jgi:DNA-binding PadR family transcriptional regulator
MELTHTAYVVLGMLRHEPRSGYEIKTVVDKSTRFFWAASYGQIYPELKRLAEAGLIDGRDEASGGRKRTVYTLTEAGRVELADWLARGAEVLEYRDEGLLKLFFAGIDPEAAAAILEAKQRLHEEKLAALRTVETATLQIKEAGDPFPDLVLRYGIESTEWMVAWCERVRAELEKGGS